MIQSSILEAIVFPDRAGIKCGGECRLTSGNHRLLFEDLPPTLEIESLRAGGDGQAEVRIQSVDLSVYYHELTPSESLRTLEKELEDVGDKIGRLEDQAAGLQEELKILDGYRQETGQYARGLATGRTNIEEQMRMLEFLRQRDQEIRIALRENGSEQRELTRKRERIKNDLAAGQSENRLKRFNASIELEVLSEGDFRPQLRYITRQAGWRPLYDLRFTDMENESRLELDYLAQIHQNTGQDWRGVRLTVSTARPALNQRLPDLDPWILDLFRPPPPAPQASERKKRAARPSAKMDDGFGDLELAAAMEIEEPRPTGEPPPREAEAATSEIRQTGTTVSFLVPGQCDIPGNGSPHKVTLNRFPFSPEIDYLAVPRHTEAVFRRLTVKNSTGVPLLPGDTSLFCNDEFIGRGRLDFTAPDDETRLMFGVEERITIKRELDRRRVDKRLLRDIRRLEYAYSISLKNLRSNEATVEVKDQFPLSHHEGISVKTEQPRPEPEKITDLNQIIWRERIPPGEERKLYFQFVVEHDRDKQITGLTD